jgi:hypothetical protein
MDAAIQETIAAPALVVQSVSDAGVWLYYRYLTATLIGDKWLCVVVKESQGDAFILTAYFTDRIKKGTLLWSANS